MYYEGTCIVEATKYDKSGLTFLIRWTGNNSAGMDYVEHIYHSIEKVNDISNYMETINMDMVQLDTQIY